MTAERITQQPMSESKPRNELRLIESAMHDQADIDTLSRSLTARPPHEAAIGVVGVPPAAHRWKKSRPQGRWAGPETATFPVALPRPSRRAGSKHSRNAMQCHLFLRE